MQAASRRLDVDLDTLLHQHAPVFLLDADRYIVKANLLMLWNWMFLRIGQPCEPREFIHKNIYDVLALAIEQGWLDPRDEHNRHFIGRRLRSTFSVLHEQHPAYRRFCRAVYKTDDDQAYWDEVTASYSGQSAEVSASFYDVVMNRPDGGRLHYLVVSRHLRNGWRLVTYTPEHNDNPYRHHDEVSKSALDKAHGEILRTYDHVKYVQDKDGVAFYPRKNHNNVGNMEIVKPITQKVYDSNVREEHQVSDMQGYEPVVHRLRQQGIVFHSVPTTIVPGMPYTTPKELAKSDAVTYSQKHILRLVREGEIAAQRIGDEIMIDPRGVEQLLTRQAESIAGELGPRGRKPGTRPGSPSGPRT
jgi:hypothetical protein